jgi:ribosomal protein L32
MTAFSRMPRYDIRNDGAGPFAVFYCEACDREFRSQPDIAGTVAQDLGRQVAGGLLRKVPVFGSVVANSVSGEDPRYSYKLTSEQLNKAWQQVQAQFRECPTCNRIVCLSDFDSKSGFCSDDSPRTAEIAEARGEQTGAAFKGFAAAFGLGDVMKEVQQAAKTVQSAATQVARCPNCGVMAAPGTRFCPECGTPMLQPASDKCPNCGQETHGAKFCPNCGTKIEAAPKAGVCPKCGAESKGAKFCPECGTKIG